MVPRRYNPTTRATPVAAASPDEEQLRRPSSRRSGRRGATALFAWRVARGASTADDTPKIRGAQAACACAGADRPDRPPAAALPGGVGLATQPDTCGWSTGVEP